MDHRLALFALVLVCAGCGGGDAEQPSDTAPSSLRKCCPRDASLVFTEDGFNCSSPVDARDARDPWWWLPGDAFADKTLLARQHVAYDTRPTCDLTSMDVLRFDPVRKWREFGFHHAADDDDVLRLDVLKESTFHEPDVRRDVSFPPATYCVDVVADDGGGRQHLHVAILCPCVEVACVRKCCHDGSVFDKSSGACVHVEGDTLNGEDFFDWVPKLDQYKEYYRLVGTVPKCDKFTSHVVTSTLNGSRLLLTGDGSLQDVDSDEVFRKDEYCGVHSSANEEMILFCLRTNPEAATKRLVYGVMFLVGAGCLLATVLVAAILSEMRRGVNGKMALAHNAVLFVGYLTTGISQLKGSTMSQSECEATSLIIQFSILAAFFWLNVMCVDIAWTFSGVRPLKGSHREVEEKKFLYYSLYAWGSTALISAATLLVEYSPSVTRFKPNFGTQMCFFNDRGAELLFFYGPMALLLASNLLLFVYIAFKIPEVNKQTTKKGSKNKQKLVLYSKLFCLMGVTWVTEVISWAVGGPSYLWYFTDLINLLRAVFIFVLFCCKRSVYVMLRDKVLRALGREVPDKNPAHNTKSCYSNDSDGKTTSTPGGGVGPPTPARNTTTPPSHKSEVVEMNLRV